MCIASDGQDGGQYGFFVHPAESVTLPLKYQCFRASIETVGDGYCDDATEEAKHVNSQNMQNKLIKVC